MQETDSIQELHSKIPLHSGRAEVIKATSAIIWDELPMAHRSAVECVDRLCRQLRDASRPFGGIPFIGVGDFRQVAPVVRNGGETATLLASIKSSSLWNTFQLRTLTIPMHSASNLFLTGLVDSIGEDTSGSRVQLHDFPHVDSLTDAGQFLFPNHVLFQPDECLTRAFLTVLNVDVDVFNQHVMDRLEGPQGKSLTPFRP